MSKIKVAICGYGNLGKGVEKAVKQQPDMELVCIITRRNLETLITDSVVPIIGYGDVFKHEWVDAIDVVIMCGGSAKDLPEQVPEFAAYFNTVDSFDTHAKIPEYFKEVDKQARYCGTLSIISTGWDPGLFSLIRVMAASIFPQSTTYTFWGPGVSQGHSDAIRQMGCVKDAVQLTIPVQEAMQRVRNGENPEFSKKEMHERECYVVEEEWSDRSQIENKIKSMPNYFADYNTTVEFVDEARLEQIRGRLPHGGNVISSATTGDGNKMTIEYSLKLDSNPEFTGAVLTAYARAAYRMNMEGEAGAITILDVPIAKISPKSREELLEMV